MFSEMDMSLSFKIIKTLGFKWPVWLNASNAIPAVIAPSPIIATCFLSGLDSFDAAAIPSRALNDVLECPTPKASYSLSFLEGNGASPSFFRIV